MILPTLHCKRCGYKWMPRQATMPVACPSCHYRNVVEVSETKEPATPGPEDSTIVERRVYQVAEVAALTGRSRSLIYNTADSIPGCIRIGRTVSFSKVTIDAWLAGLRYQNQKPNQPQADNQHSDRYAKK